MFTPRRLLVPVDFSDCSKRALRFAYDLAIGTDALVDVVHIWQPPSFVSPDLLVFDPEADSVSLREWVRDEATRTMELFKKELEPPEGLRVEFRLANGDPADQIDAIVAATKPDLVVMGTHGRTGVARLLAGSVAERTVRKATCPVLTVPPEPHEA